MKLVLIAKIAAGPDPLILLKRLKRLDGYNDRELSKLLGINGEYLRDILRGFRPISEKLLLKIKKALGKDEFRVEPEDDYPLDWNWQNHKKWDKDAPRGLDPIIEPEEHESLDNLMVDPGYLEEGMERREIINHLKDKLGILSPKERLIIEMHYFQDKTFEEIGLFFRPVLSKQRVRQIEEMALLKIRDRWGSNWPRSAKFAISANKYIKHKPGHKNSKGELAE